MLTCLEAQSCDNGKRLYDLIVACFNTGQVRGIQADTYLTGPLAEIGTAPQALAVDQNVLLTADGIDRREAKLPELHCYRRHICWDGFR